MMLKKLVAGLFLLFALQSMSFAYSTFPTNQAPIDVGVGLFVNDVTQVNEHNSTLQIDGTLTLQWKDARLAFDSALTSGQLKEFSNSAALRELNQIWQPGIVMHGGRGPMNISARYLTISSLGEVTYVQRFLGLVETHMNYSHFPFDSQTAQFILQPFIYTASQVRLQILKGREGVGVNATMGDWEPGKVTSGVELTHNKVGQKVSRYSLNFRYSRNPAFYLIQIFVPLILIVFFSFTVFWMTHNPLVNRVAISLTAILTIVVFQWRIFSSLPHVSYHTFLDVFMFISFIVAALTMVPSVMFDHMKEHSKALVYHCRWIFPTGYALILLVLVLVYFA